LDEKLAISFIKISARLGAWLAAVAADAAAAETEMMLLPLLPYQPAGDLL